MLRARVLAGVLAIASCALATPAFAWSVLVFLIAAQGPDAHAPAGDPCCTPADTWGQVAFGVVWGAALGGFAVALLYAAITMVEFAIKGERPRLLRPRRVVASVLTALGLVLAWTLIVFVAV